MDEFAAPLLKNVDTPKIPLPCPFSAQGMLQPSQNQPPPMFGPRGTTIPPKHLNAFKPRPTHFGSNSNQTEHRPKFQPRNHQHQQRPRFQPYHHQPANGERHFNQFRPQHFHHQPNSVGTTVSREFYCETCDRDFRSVDQLAEHREEHQRCGIDGCKFEGHEAMVSKHIQQQHSTGLYEKIKNLNTPEDIEKWREERRKRFPTAKNVELRKKIQEARNKRGERLEDSKSRFGPKRDRRSGPGAPSAGPTSQQQQQQQPDLKKKRRKRKPNNQRSEKEEEKLGKPDAVKEVITNGSLVMFQGTAGLTNYKRPKVEVQNALSGFLGDYGTDESDNEEADTTEESEEETVIPILSKEFEVVDPSSEKPSFSVKPPMTIEDSSIFAVQVKTSASDPVETKNISLTSASTVSNDSHQQDQETNPKGNAHKNPFSADRIDSPVNDPAGDDAPEEAIVQRVSDLPLVEESTSTQPQKRQHKRNDAPQPTKKPKPTTILDLSKRYRNQNTMLEKLLQKDIRHERNVLLQCVRHVVENNFFGVGQNSSKVPITSPSVETDQ